MFNAASRLRPSLLLARKTIFSPTTALSPLIRSQPYLSANYTPIYAMDAKRKFPARSGGFNKKQRTAKVKPRKEGGAEETLEMDVKLLLDSQPPREPTPAPAEVPAAPAVTEVPAATEDPAAVPAATADPAPTPAAELAPTMPVPFSTIELEIVELSSSGDGLALHDGRVYVVPFSLPGDRVSAKVIRHNTSHTITDFLSVVRASPDRDDSLIGCKYFATCSGCQLQMLPYDKQLEHKRRVIEKAYAHFASLPAGILPPIGPTIGSPLQYNYRTKLTPHFDGPRL